MHCFDLFSLSRTSLFICFTDEEKLDLLINNAGIMWGPREITQEGIESQLGVNHMGHFLLTNLLVDKLKVYLLTQHFNL